jgi:hypothetical protein
MALRLRRIARVKRMSAVTVPTALIGPAAARGSIRR